MKNVLFLVIDACNQDYLGPKSYRPSNSPYLDQLRKKSRSFTQMYSCGPYTEAAMMELMAGYRTLDHNSFIANLAYAPETIFEAFSKAGYETYASILSFGDYQSFLRGVSAPCVEGGPSYHEIYYGRIRFYGEQYRNKTLPEAKYGIMEKLMCDYFDADLDFFRRLLQNDRSVAHLKRPGRQDADIRQMMAVVKKEQESFCADPRAYVIGLMEQGEKHTLLQMEWGPSWNQTEEFRRDLDDLIRIYQPLIRRMKKLQKEGNRRYIGHVLRHTCTQIKMAFAAIGKLFKTHTFNLPRLKDAVASPLLELSIYSDLIIRRVFTPHKDLTHFKNVHCAKEMYRHFLDWYDHDRHAAKPFFAYIHVDDIHLNPIPFSWGSDKTTLADEFAYMKSYVDQLDARYHGNIMYDLGIHHVDHQIQQFMEALQMRNALENTMVIVTADHGYYYSYQHFRHDSIGNLLCENFHIPFIMHDAEQTKGYTDTGLHMQRDIPYTLVCEILNRHPHESWSGENLLTSIGRPCVLLEYPGRGSPDLDTKVLFFACFDEHYKIVVKARLQQVLTMAMITEIYDRRKDETDGENIIHKTYDHAAVEALYDVVFQRFTKLQKTYVTFPLHEPFYAPKESSEEE